MKWGFGVVFCSTWLGACSVLVDTSGLSAPEGSVAGAGAADGRSDALASDGATPRDGLVVDVSNLIDVVADDADGASCTKAGRGCSSNEECCSKKCGVFPFIFCN